MKKKLSLLIVAILIISTSITAFGQSFDYEKSWAKNEISYMIEQGILTGYGDGTFRPSNNMTRAEFYTVINRLTNATEKEEVTFLDVNESDWFYDEVAKGLKVGYILAATELKPKENIIRGEVARILGFVFEIEENELAVEDLADHELIPQELKGVIGGLKHSGVIKGYPDGTFGANKEITRAEVARIIYKFKEEMVELKDFETKEEVAEPKIEEEKTIEVKPQEEEKPKVESAESITSKYYSKLSSLQASIEGSLDALVAQAQAEIYAGGSLGAIYNKYESKASQLESSADSSVASLISSLEAELIENGYDPSSANELYNQYESIKAGYKINIVLP